jgi:hypothetical protein
MQHDTYENVLPMLKKIFGLSRTSAYISLDYSVKLFGRSKSIVNFGDTNLYNKIIESYNRAKAAGNHQAEAMVLSVFNRFMARQKATSDLEQPVNNITLQITANPEDVGLQSYSEEQIAELEKMVVERKKLRD